MKFVFSIEPPSPVCQPEGKGRGPMGCGLCQTVNKVYFFDLCCKSLAEFRRPQTAEEGQIVFSGGVYVGKHTPQAASVRAKASARRGLHPLEKMLAFLRSVSKFFDTLKTMGTVLCRHPIRKQQDRTGRQASGDKRTGDRLRKSAPYLFMPSRLLVLGLCALVPLVVLWSLVLRPMPRRA